MVRWIKRVGGYGAFLKMGDVPYLSFRPKIKVMILVVIYWGPT